MCIFQTSLFIPGTCCLVEEGGGEASCVDGQTTSPPAAVPTPGSVESIKGKSQMTTSQSELLLLYSVSPYTSNAFVLYGIFSSRFLITTQKSPFFVLFSSIL